MENLKIIDFEMRDRWGWAKGGHEHTLQMAGCETFVVKLNFAFGRESKFEF
jgi:hypothetical protein